jgi:dsDNA-specific endonuclease/ATPase MutS2
MSMLNMDGQLVASALLNQQSGDVFNGILQHRREMRAAEMQQQQQSADQQHYARLVSKYNNLADRYNDVLADNKKVDAAYAAALAEKDRQIAELEGKNSDVSVTLMLRERLVDVLTEKYDDLLSRHKNGLP